MKIRNIIASAALAIALAAPAQVSANDADNYVYVPQITLNDKGESMLVVFLDTYVTEFNTMMMDLYLPEGFSLQTDASGQYKFIWNTEDGTVTNHSFTTSEKDGYITLLAYSATDDCIAQGNHWLFAVYLNGPENLDAPVTASLKNIRFSEGTVQNHVYDDVNFTIDPYDPMSGVGAVEIPVVDGDTRFYNLNGLAIPTPEIPGIYIVKQNGIAKKVLIK
ncbi:MAG: hypothetical protein K2M19_01250 [Muribaculaceae bacterium]|nr:hypothetical protein [Muribaculaceae bacterium]